ncbi:alpha/beta hydrolase [Hyphobacterium sp. CCMP332]|nr:alpha/beta hydrolase [Hyphobacterium sp. CCMP332]
MLYSETHLLDPNKQWIVFIHGAGGNISTWKFQIPFFQNHFNLLLIDLKGHGNSKSQEIEKAYTFKSIAEDINELMIHHNIERAHFIGLSIGSLIIHSYCDLYPHKVSSLIGTGGIYKINWQIHYFSKSAYLLAKIFPYPFLYKVFAYIVMPRKNHNLSRKIFIKASQKLVRREYLRWLNLYAKFRETVSQLDFSKQNKAVLVVMGEEDHLFLKPARDFCSLYSGSQLKVMPKSGHICNIENPQQYNQIVFEFIMNSIQ